MSESQDHDAFSLVSWNLFQGLHHRGGSRRPQANDQVETHLRDLDADVLVLQEAWRFRRTDSVWAEDLAEMLGYELHQWVGQGPSRPRDVAPWRMVILTRLPASRLDDQVLPQVGKLGQRALVRVRLASGITIAGGHLYGVHALRRTARGWLSERGALRQATATNDVVAGDMNMWGPVVGRDLGDLRRVVSGRTYPSPRPHSQIDHVLVSSRLDVLEADVLEDMGSDHRAVRVVLRPNTAITVGPS